jgi:O-antigen biosynthesis rhamnosyltransferase
MKILHFYKVSYPESMGGVEQFIHHVASGGIPYGIESDVLSLTTQNKFSMVEIEGYRVHRVPIDFQLASSSFSFAAISKFRTLAADSDIIHYHFPWPFMDMVHFLTGVSKPTVVSYHSDIIRQQYLLKLYRPLKCKFLADVDAIISASPNYLLSSEVLTRYQDKVSVIPYGLCKDSYPKVDQELMNKWSAKLGGKFFLFVGVLRYYKGLHILMEAARGAEFPIVILGAGPIEKVLKKQAGRLGLRNVHFLGAVSDEDKVALINLSYGIVFPSHLRSEAFGIALLEAAMYGKPMISSEIGTGTTFVNIADQTGIVVPPSNAFALRTAMQYLWDHPGEAARMGKNAELRYLKYFTADTMVRGYLNLYQMLLNNS